MKSLSISEVAERAGCSLSTVARGYQSRTLAVFRNVGEVAYRVEVDECDRWIAWRIANPHRRWIRKTRPEGAPLLASELGRLAGVSKTRIYQHVRAGLIPAFHVRGVRGVWIKDEDAAAFLATRSRK